MLKNLRRRLSQSVEEIHEVRLQSRFAGLDVSPIAAAPPRAPVRMAGEVQGTQVVPRAGSPSLEVTISDGTGRAVAVFTGRRRLGGVECGRSVLIEGVGRTEHGHILVLNPAYQLLD
ncbi:MAG: hypothetical protein JWN46_1962 [Acidimicrobiales bacterium]|nr:hypothetical protein [Acidimicrobiales bacterium]